MPTVTRLDQHVEQVIDGVEPDGCALQRVGRLMDELARSATRWSASRSNVEYGVSGHANDSSESPRSRVYRCQGRSGPTMPASSISMPQRTNAATNSVVWSGRSSTTEAGRASKTSYALVLRAVSSGRRCPTWRDRTPHARTSS